MPLNPAASVRGERYQVIEGKTPEITAEQARTLMKSIHTVTAVGRRDLAIIGVLIYTAARAGAVARLCHKHFAYDGSQWTLRFEEKGGKSREIPVRHDLQKLLLDYLKAADRDGKAPADTPLFRSALRNTGRLTANAITGLDNLSPGQAEAQRRRPAVTPVAAFVSGRDRHRLAHPGRAS
jgi:integrase